MRQNKNMGPLHTDTELDPEREGQQKISPQRMDLGPLFLLKCDQVPWECYPSTEIFDTFFSNIPLAATLQQALKSNPQSDSPDYWPVLLCPLPGHDNSARLETLLYLPRSASKAVPHRLE